MVGAHYYIISCHGRKVGGDGARDRRRQEGGGGARAAGRKEAPAPEAIKLKKEAPVHEAVTVGKEAPAKNMDTIVTQSQSTARTFSGTKDGTVRGGMQEEVARRGRGGTRSRGRSYYYFSCINLEHDGVTIGDCAAAPAGPAVDPREVHRSLVRRTSRLTRHPPSSWSPARIQSRPVHSWTPTSSALPKGFPLPRPPRVPPSAPSRIPPCILDPSVVDKIAVEVRALPQPPPEAVKLHGPIRRRERSPGRTSSPPPTTQQRTMWPSNISLLTPPLSPSRRRRVTIRVLAKTLGREGPRRRRRRRGN